jgi:hypothetical protein
MALMALPHILPKKATKPVVAPKPKAKKKAKKVVRHQNNGR